MGDVIVSEGTATTVFEPLLGRLVSTDEEFPRQFGHIGEAFLFVNPDTVILVLQRFDDIVVAWFVKFGIFQFGHFLHQMQTTQLPAEVGQTVMFRCMLLERLL